MELCAKMLHSLKASTVQLAKLAVWWSSTFRCLIWLASNSKCDSASCYVRHDEDISHNQRPEAATTGGLWKKGFLEISQNPQENVCDVCQSLFNKVAGLRLGTLLKKRLWHRYFPVIFTKFLKNTFFTEHSWTTASVLNVNFIQGFFGCM